MRRGREDSVKVEIRPGYYDGRAVPRLAPSPGQYKTAICEREVGVVMWRAATETTVCFLSRLEEANYGRRPDGFYKQTDGDSNE